MTREQMYNDIQIAKEYVENYDLKYGFSPEWWKDHIYYLATEIRAQAALLTVLYAGRWQHSFFGAAFVMPSTRDCLGLYPSIRKNLGKKISLKKGHYDEEEYDWEGYSYFSIENFREKKTA